MRPLIRKAFVALLLVALPIWFYLSPGRHLPPAPIAWYDRIVFKVVTPPLRGIRWIEEEFFQLMRRTFFLLRAERENEALKKEILALRVREFFFEGVARENERLSRLLDFQQSLPYRAIPAQVIAFPPLGEFRLMMINQGSEQGVLRGAAVISPDGLVGRVFRAENRVAQILLMTDPTSAVDARVLRNGSRGLVVGRGDNAALEFWDRAQEVGEGDSLVTSGLDGNFPPEIPIGKVHDIRRDAYEVFQAGKVIPAVPFNKLDEVLVLQPR